MVAKGFPRVPKGSQHFPRVPKRFPRVFQWFSKGLPRLPGFTKDTQLVAVSMEKKTYGDGWVG